MQFDTRDDVQLYLEGSYVGYENEPAYIYETVSRNKVMIETKGGTKTVDIVDLDLSIKPLGYLYSEVDKASVFAKRIPSRQWRLGLTSSTITVDDGYFELGIHNDFVHFLFNAVYLNLKEAFTKSKNGGGVVPFNRMYAINRLGLIEYKRKVVGSFDGEELKLLSPYKYLEEELEEIVDEC